MVPLDYEPRTVAHRSSMMTSGGWWMLETLNSSTFRVSMPHRLPLPSASLARQWSSWRCVWGRYHVGIMRPGLRREGIMLCFSRSQYMLVFMVPSMNCSSPAALMQPQTMALPPSCLTVGKTHLSFYSSPGCRHTHLTPSEPNTFILVPSDHRTCFQ